MLPKIIWFGLTFVGVNFYDGQGFMVRKDSGITSTSQFKNGISACTNIGTTTELNMRDFFNSKGISYTPVAFEKAVVRGAQLILIQGNKFKKINICQASQRADTHTNLVGKTNKEHKYG